VRNIFANILLLALALAFLMHFSLIIAWGQVTVQEPNRLILGLEMAGLTAIAGLAVYNLAKSRKDK